MADQTTFMSVFRNGMMVWVDFLDAAAQAGRNLLNTSSAGDFTVLHVEAGQETTYNFPADGIPTAALQLSGNFVGPGNIPLVANKDVKITDPGGADLHALVVTVPPAADPGAYQGSVQGPGGNLLRSFRVVVV